MDKDILKKALLRGAGTGVCTWIIYALVFEMLIDHESFQDAFFSTGSLIFLVVMILVEIVVYYMNLSKAPKKEER